MILQRFHREGGLSGWRHYVLPPEYRRPGIHALIDEERDLVVTGPKGVGKTTLFFALAQELRSSGRYAAIFVRCRPEWRNADTALEELRRQIVKEGRKLPRGRRPARRFAGSSLFRLRDLISAWSLRCDGGAVLFVDDLEKVERAARLIVLRQLLRCSARPEEAPLHLVAVLGSNSIADDVRQIEEETKAATGTPFEARRRPRVLELGRFQTHQVGSLYDLHTARTRQVFTEEAKETAFQLTHGDPQKVNAVADEALRQVPRSRSVEGKDIRAAYDNLWPKYLSSSTVRELSPASERDEGTAPRRLLSPAFFFTAILLVSLALAVLVLGPLLFLARSPEPDTSELPIRDLELKKIAHISEPESLEELCADFGTSAEKFEACRKKLSVFGRTYIWIDTDSLVKPGETLGTEHLGLLYGVARPQDEASRQALAAVLVAECLEHLPPAKGAAPFADLFEDRCKESLPSLAHLGLEIDPTWLAPEEGETDIP